MSIPLAKFTTYLGTLVTPTLDGRQMNTKKLQINPLIEKEILGKYEATLTFCCYIARLNYENRPRKALKAYNLLDYSPLVFNKGLSALTYSKSTDTKIEPDTTKAASGFLLYDSKQDTPLSITLFDYSKRPSNIFGNQKIIVVSFRGTLSIQTALKDLNAIYSSLFNLFGKDLFSEEAAILEKRGKSLVNPFGAHRGFVNGLENVYSKIIDKLTILLTANPDVSRIFVTGHSLGGAFASIMGLGLAQHKKKKHPALQTPAIHVITFGAPKTFTDYARNVFNGLLLDGYMTLDRVANRPRFPDPTMMSYDPIPLVPPNLDHPGFMILKPEIKTQSRTGRTKHIAELRDELAGIQAKKSMLTSLTSRNYNALPDYLEFFKMFKDTEVDSSFTVDEYKSLIETTVTGTVRTSMGSAKKVIDIVKRILGLNDNEIEEAAATAETAVKDEVAGLKAVTLPPQLGKEEAETAALVEGEYAAVGEQEPQSGGLFGFGKTPVAASPVAASPVAASPVAASPVAASPMANTTNAAKKNTAMYKELTVKTQPNHVVYSCSQITGAGIPGIGCHLGYMGVSFVGGGLNAGSGTVVGQRDYKEEATLYCSNGNWTYVPTMTPPSGPLTGGKYSRKKRSSRKRLTRKR